MISKQALGAMLLAALIFSSAPGFAAKGFNYTYVDAGYEYVDGDDENFKLGAVEASFDTFDYVALRAGFRRGTVEDYEPAESIGASDPDYTEFQFGARGHYSLVKKKLDGYAGANWFYSSINQDDISSNSNWGGIFDVGLRYKPFKWLEMDVSGRHRVVDSGSNDTVLMIGPIIKVTKKLSINLRTSQLGDNDAYFGGLRLDL